MKVIPTKTKKIIEGGGKFDLRSLYLYNIEASKPLGYFKRLFLL